MQQHKGGWFSSSSGCCKVSGTVPKFTVAYLGCECIEIAKDDAVGWRELVQIWHVFTEWHRRRLDGYCSLWDLGKGVWRGAAWREILRVRFGKTGTGIGCGGGESEREREREREREGGKSHVV